MNKIQGKKEKRVRRHARIRSKISGTSLVPRLSVFKSNRHISVQLIDDENSVTVASVHSNEVGGKSMMEKSVLVGSSIAKKALLKNIKSIVFDRGGFVYTGRIKALADGARSGGLVF